MKKSFLFFAAIMGMIIGSTLFVSCGGDDDDDVTPGATSYVYTSEITLSNDIVNIYGDITAKFQYPDGVTKDVKVTSTKITERYESEKLGNVTVSLEGDLKTETVEDDKSYTIGISHIGKCNSSLDMMDLSSTKKGNILKDKYTKLSSIASAKHTYIFVKD